MRQCALLIVGLAGCSGAPFPWSAAEIPTSVRVDHTEVATLIDDYDRAGQSPVLLRRIKRATRANLDYAAYIGNGLINMPPDERAGVLRGRIRDKQAIFGGVIESTTLVGSLAQTPLTRAERSAPLPFSPLLGYLNRKGVESASALEQVQAAVRAETWGLRPTPGVYYQQIARAYVHRGKRDPEMWVQIEFHPWAKLFDGMPDADGDGFFELYGRLRDGALKQDALKLIENDYRRRVLQPKELHAWANELASYWYPSYFTDIVEPAVPNIWPTPATEAAVVTSLSGRTVKNPAVIVRGKPQGKALYLVLLIDNFGAKPNVTAAGHTDAQLKKVALSPQPGPLITQIAAELKAHGGNWGAWSKQVAPLRRQIRRQLARRPKRLRALAGRDGFLFYRNSLEYLIGGDVQRQSAAKNPLPTIVAFKRLLQRANVDFLLVPVPTKAEVFPEKLLDLPAAAQPPIVHPHGRKFLLELATAGVEVIDLLPAYLRARTRRRPNEEFLYQPQDTHWTDRGLQIAAELIAARIRTYPWHALLRPSGKFTLKRVTFTQHGDLHSRLAPREQPRYRPATLVGHQVLTPAGKLYDDDPESPIVVLGDSFTGVFQRTYCQHAGVSAHIAKRLAVPIDLVMSYGGGPNVRKKLLSRGKEALKRKRLLIWILAARDFYNYWEDWQPLSGS